MTDTERQELRLRLSILDLLDTRPGPWTADDVSRHLATSARRVRPALGALVATGEVHARPAVGRAGRRAMGYSTLSSAEATP